MNTNAAFARACEEVDALCGVSVSTGASGFLPVAPVAGGQIGGDFVPFTLAGMPLAGPAGVTTPFAGSASDNFSAAAGGMDLAGPAGLAMPFAGPTSDNFSAVGGSMTVAGSAGDNFPATAGPAMSGAGLPALADPAGPSFAAIAGDGNMADPAIAGTEEGAGEGVLTPTCTGFPANTADFMYVVEAVRRGHLHLVGGRAKSLEQRQNLVKSGNIIVYTPEYSGVRRWTDGVKWSSSRVLGDMLVYREVENARRTREQMEGDEAAAMPAGYTNSLRPYVGSLLSPNGYRQGGLVKKSFSIALDGTVYTVIAYYTLHDVQSGLLSRVRTRNPWMAGLELSQELLCHKKFTGRVVTDDYNAGSSADYASWSDQPLPGRKQQPAALAPPAAQGVLPPPACPPQLQADGSVHVPLQGGGILIQHLDGSQVHVSLNGSMHAVMPPAPPQALAPQAYPMPELAAPSPAVAQPQQAPVPGPSASAAAEDQDPDTPEGRHAQLTQQRNQQLLEARDRLEQEHQQAQAQALPADFPAPPAEEPSIPPPPPPSPSTLLPLPALTGHVDPFLLDSSELSAWPEFGLGPELQLPEPEPVLGLGLGDGFVSSDWVTFAGDDWSFGQGGVD